MTNLKQIASVFVLVCALLSATAAQDSTTAPKTTLTITANASGDRVRVTAPSSVVQMRLEVYAGTGVKLFDEELRGANVFDWHLQDGQAQRVAAGDYVCLVTAKTISGKITQKIGSVNVAEKSASVRAGDPQQFTSPQAQAIGPVEADSSWTIVRDGENQTTTVIANTGSEGQMIRGRGALSFRIGDFFSAKDEEQMRLTEEGNLGLGTSTPQSKLDVAGTIRAERFLVARSGSKTTGAMPTTESASSVQPLVAGTGTTGQLPKWTDGPSGTLGDSGITETAGGNVGIGTNSPGDKLEIAGSNGNVTIGQLFGAGYNSIYLNGLAGTGNYNFLSKNTDQNLYLNRPAGKDIYFRENNSFDQLFLKSGGNVGIGTNSPGDKLDIAGPSGSITIGQLFGTSYNSIYLNGLSGTGNYNFLSKNADQNLYMNRPSGKDIRFRENNVDQITLQAGGNVGIGTTNPLSKLDVAGSGDINAKEYKIGGTDVLRMNGSRSLFVGRNTGPINVGSDNTFVGDSAGKLNTMGLANSFVGSSSGFSNRSGSFNAFFGFNAGSQMDGDSNSFFGEGTGFNIGSGNDNAFFGSAAGGGGTFARTNSGNTLLGARSDSVDGVTNASAIGFQAKVTQSNSLVLGSINGVNTSTVDTRVGIGTTAPVRHLHVMGASDQEIAIESTDSGGRQWTLQSSRGTFDGRFEIVDRTANANRFTILSTGEVGIGTTAPGARLQVKSGDIYVETVNKGIILRTPDGTKCYRVTVDNAGDLTTSQVTCP